MNINITLVIQACNFFIAYLIMERILFRPAINVLDGQESEERLIKERIEHVDERIIQQEQDKAQRWKECKRGLHIPDVQQLDNPLAVDYPEHMPYKDPDPIIKHVLAKELKSLVVERITHGR